MNSITPDPERWQKLSALFDQASELDAEQRKQFLDVACADDKVMREQLDAMLAADGATGLLDQKAEVVANIRSNDAAMNEEARKFIGTQIGDWKLDAVLGRGGMATVWSVHRVVDGITQYAALKRLHKFWCDSVQSDRFLQERRILASLSHPYIARLFDGGMHDGLPWFALERIEGLPLTEFANAQKLSLRDRVKLMIRVCDAVQHAHERFVVHRDLKPSNVLIDGDGHPKVLDFGVAKLLEEISDGATRHGTAGYTPEYAAPEQMRDGLITAATDVYALGVLFFELLTGKLPFTFDHRDIVAVSKTITSVPLPKPEIAIQEGSADDVAARLHDRKTSLSAFSRFVRGDIHRMLQTMLAKEAERRYASVEAMSADLRRFLDGNAVSVSGDTLTYRLRKFIGRNRWAVAMASAASIFLLAGVAGVLIQTGQAQREAGKAIAEAKRADTEAAHARREVERLSATNDFLSDVFGGAEESISGTPNLTLEKALDTAVVRAEKNHKQHPELAVRVLIAAANSYLAMGKTDRAAEMVQKGLAVQMRELPNALEDRAYLLSLHAYVIAGHDPKKCLELAKEAVALHKKAKSNAGLANALSVLVLAQYGVNDIEGALQTSRESVRVAAANGGANVDSDIVTGLSNEAMLLGMLGRHEEAAATHARVIEHRIKAFGSNSVSVANERMYYALSLVSAKQYGQAVTQLDMAMPVFRKDLESENSNLYQAMLIKAQALNGLARYSEALPLLASVHDFGRQHEFAGRQDEVANEYLVTLVKLGQCKKVNTIRKEMLGRKLVSNIPGATGFTDKACTENE